MPPVTERSIPPVPVEVTAPLTVMAPAEDSVMAPSARVDAPVISTAASRVTLRVIPTDEERVIARDSSVSEGSMPPGKMCFWIQSGLRL